MKISEKTKSIIKKTIPYIFVLYILITCITWAINTEYDSAPDENLKYKVCVYLAEHLKLPHGGEEQIRDKLYGISYAFTPILSYMFSALFMRIASLFTSDLWNIFLSARFVSAVCIAGYAIMVIKISRKLFKEKIYRALFVTFLTLLPQILYMGSYINNDSLALLAVSIIIYSWILGLEESWSWKSCIILAIGIGICALSYYNAYGYILCSVIIYCISCLSKKIKFKEFLKKGIAISAIVLSLAGWWFVRSYIIYDGDFLGLNISREYSEKYAMESRKPSNRYTPANTNENLVHMLTERGWIRKTELSTIGVFGYMDAPMNKSIYIGYEIVGCIGIAGGIISGIALIIRKIEKQKDNRYAAEEVLNGKDKLIFDVNMFISFVIPICLSIYYSYFNDYQPQGRYIMSAIIPFIYFIVGGYKFIFEKIIKNKTIRNVVLGIIILAMIIMPIYIFFNYINGLPTFYMNFTIEGY